MLNDPTGQGASHSHGLMDSYRPGMRVGGSVYLLKRILGRGATGVVWLAHDVKLARDVALKILPDSLLRDPNAAERLKKQVAPLSNFQHPNIVTTYGFVQDFRLIALSTEYVEGWSLATMRVDKDGKRFTLEEITGWVRQFCSALDSAHAAGIVHGDLRPSHLLLDAHERIKLGSFISSAALRSITVTGNTAEAVETLGFISPQQALGEAPTRADDIYGLGATLFGLLTGTPPFYKGQVLAQICERKAPTINERLAELQIDDPVPPAIDDAIAQCLAKKTEDRPQTIAAVLGLLERTEFVVPDAKRVEVPTDPKASPSLPAGEKKTEAQPAQPSPEAEPKRVVPEALSVQSAETTDTTLTTSSPEKRGPLALVGALAFVAFALAIFAWVLKTHHGHAAPSGSVDLSFHPPILDVEARIAAVQPDKKLLVGGRFLHVGVEARRGLARLNSDGTVDTNFSASIEGDVHALAVQSDGRLVIGGEFNQVNSKVRHRIARLNPDGTLDQSFNSRLNPNRELRALLVQPDGKIIAAGNFDRLSGKKVGRVTRLNADGSVDTTFNPGSGASAVVWGVALQPDGRLIVVGKFDRFDGQPCGRIVRLEPDGSIDQSFATGAGANMEIFAAAVQKDGRVVLGGEFYQFNSIECNRIARLNRDGSIDSSFAPGAGPNTGIRCLTLDGAGKILIGGVFTSVGGAARNRIARLTQNGLLDATLDPGEGASEVVRWITMQPDGRILLVGGFKKFAGSDVACVTRLAGDALLVSK